MANKKNSKAKKVSILQKPLSFAIIIGSICAGIAGIVKVFASRKGSK